MPIWVNNAQGQTEVDSPWSKQAGYSFCHLYRTHKMCLFSPASEWPPLGGMEKIPHFYKALTKAVFLFDTLIKSKFYFFWNFWSLSKTSLFAQEPLKLKAICLNQIGIMDKRRTGQLANAQEEKRCMQ